MSSKVPVTEAELAELPPKIRALISRIIDYYERRIAELESRLNRTPQNSSLPPSAVHPHAKPAPRKPKSKRKRGGQPGHAKYQRPLIPTKDCDHVQSLKPALCRRCGENLLGHDPTPLRHQVWELPEIKPIVKEYQLHRLTCRGCGAKTCAQLPPGVPFGQAGPRLVALVALLMGCFRLSKRRVAIFLEHVLAQPCSTGWIVKLQHMATQALRPAYEELAASLPEQPVVKIDETPTKEGPRKSWLWTCVAEKFTLFALRPSRAATALTELLSENYGGVVHCDRARMYLSLDRLQWCWAHLRRDFQSLVDSRAAGSKYLGQRLLTNVKRLFGHWRSYRDGTITRLALVRRMGPVRRAIEGLLERGAASGQKTYQGMCRELHEHRQRLWTFLRADGVEPTNNAAERALRHAVIWRKLSFGTQSSAGSRFVETILTLIETCRQQSRPLFAFLTKTIEHHLAGKPTPSLVANG